MVTFKQVLDDIEAIFDAAKLTLDEPTQDDLYECISVLGGQLDS